MYITCYWEVCMHFLGGENEFLCWGEFSQGEFTKEIEVSRGWAFQTKFYTGTIRQNSYTKFSYVFLSLYRLDFARGHVEGNCPR